MRPDINKTIFWNMDSPPMGCGFWPVMMGHLKSFGHSHYLYPNPNYYCPHIILKGRGFVRCHGREHPIGPGDMFTIWPGQPLEYFDSQESPWEYLWIHLGGDGVENYLNGCGFSADHMVFRPRDPDGVKNMFWQIRSLYTKRDANEIPVILKCLYELGIACGRYGREDQPLSQADIVAQAITYMKAMLNTPINISIIAESLGICRTTLYRAFVKKMDKTPIEYLSYLRIQQAKHLLQTTNLNLASISKLAGFAEQRYFMLCFRKQIGQTPGEFRIQVAKT